LESELGGVAVAALTSRGLFGRSGPVFPELLDVQAMPEGRYSHPSVSYGVTPLFLHEQTPPLFSHEQRPFSGFLREQKGPCSFFLHEQREAVFTLLA